MLMLFYSSTYDIFIACTCDPIGAQNENCDNGMCYCKEHITGDKCDQCEEIYFGFPNCQRKNPF